MISDELIKTKIELLCYGIRPTESSMLFLEEQNPYIIRKTGNIGLNILIDNKIPALVKTSHKFNKKSKYTIKKIKNKWFLFKDEKKSFEITPIKMPEWYKLKTSRGNNMSEIFLHEGTNFMHEAYIGCAYFSIGKQCKFCSTGKEVVLFEPEEYAEVVEVAHKENPEYHVCIGGGTFLTPDRKALFFTKIIKAIRKKVKDIPIFVEMVPPDDNKYIDMMMDAGANSFSMNLEIWDDGLRKEICPGKSEITKERYIEVYKYLVKKLGKGKVTCVFVTGLEPKKSLINGIEELTKIGVEIDLLPFQPFEGCDYENKNPANPKYIEEVSKIAAEMMKKNSIDPEKSYGCIKCGACTVENNYLKNLG